MATIRVVGDDGGYRDEDHVLDMSSVILAAAEPERLPEVIVALAAKSMVADDVALLVPGDDGRLHVACSTSLTDAMRRGVAMSLDIIMQRQPAGLREPMIAAHGAVRSCILYPLCSGERLAGLLAMSRVIHPRPYTQADLGHAALLAAQTLLALENMRLVRHAISTEQLATVGQVATSIAHEVNNPIAYVLAAQAHLCDRLDEALALCDRGDIDALRAKLADMRPALADVRDGAQRVRDIVRDTRALADSNDSVVAVDVNEPIRSALRITAADLRHRTSVTTVLGNDLFVLGRSGRLSRAIVNLLLHIADSFGEDSHNTIVITSCASAPHVIVMLSDNGPWLSPDRVARAFDPFAAANLATVRDIVRAHGGEVSVESAATGTTYTLRLPQIAPQRSMRSSESPPIGDAVRLRILLIDDEPNILKAYKRVLGTAHDLVFAAHGEEALARIAEHHDFDLVLCDVSMPTMSGMQLFERVREQAPALASRFVFATGGATQKTIEQFLASIPNLVLEKPFEMRVLQQLVAGVQRSC